MSKDNYKKNITNEFFKAFASGDSDKCFMLWLDDDFDPNDRDGFDEPLIMNVMFFYAKSNTKMDEAYFKEIISLIIGHEKYNPNQKNEYKEIPLFYVARYPRLNCIAKKMLDLKKTIFNQENDVGLNLFDVATSNENNAFAAMLLNTGEFMECTKGQAKIRCKTK